MTEGTRVIVGVGGTLSSLAALHRAVGEARRRDALLVPVHAWAPVGGEAVYRRSPCPPLLKEWENAAGKRLDTAFEQAFGGYPEGLRIHAKVVRGDVGEALVQTADRPDDLLVVGTGRRGRLRRLFHGSVSRYCLARATCSVLAVPPSELLDTLERMMRGADPMTLLARTTQTSGAR
ncbi:universal stress protein [Streptantibioticus ferralitis]|uniref:Universal stress protein n=1 Tax=Streptantibioticus ferralitis TaxID=236510 RepID=A0ABT5Z8I1_9ACTN|nr:universal stress protein [Streptantibioticus ferralitis]MDF2260135.1 universal stress protein [Streptantibioticus ferralitis]